MRSLFLIFIITLFIVPLHGQSSSTDTLDQKSSTWPLDSFTNDVHTFYEELEIFHDKNGNTSFEDVQKNDSLFSNNTTSENFQPDDVYWIKARFYGSPYFNGKQILTFQCNEGYSFDYVDAYLMDMKGEYQHQRTGDRVSLKERPYTISDSVNSASRIENLTKHYGNLILLSEVSLKKLDNREEFHFRYLGQVQVKGKQKLLKIYECFDGDAADIFELKLASLAEFNSGIQHYFKQSFSQAVLDFEKVVQQNHEDKAATLFLHKAKQLEKMGTVENWTGIEMMGEK